MLESMYRDNLSLVSKDSDGARVPLEDFKNLFILAEARFLFACLSKEFDPSFICVGKSNLEFVLAYKAIKVMRDFRGAAKTSSQAIDFVG